MDPIIELPSLRIPWKRICTQAGCVTVGAAGLAYGATATSYQTVISEKDSVINKAEGIIEKTENERDEAKGEVTKIKQESTSKIEEIKKDKNQAQEEFNSNQKDLNSRYIAEIEKVKNLEERTGRLQSKVNWTKNRLTSIIHGYQNKATWKRDILKLIQDL